MGLIMIYFNNIINNNKTFKTLVICLLSLNLISAFFNNSVNVNITNEKTLTNEEILNKIKRIEEMKKEPKFTNEELGKWKIEKE